MELRFYRKVVQEIAEQIAGEENWQDLLETVLDGLRADVEEKLKRKLKQQ